MADKDIRPEVFQRALGILPQLSHLKEADREFTRQYADKIRAIVENDVSLWAAIRHGVVKVENLPAIFAVLTAYYKEMVETIWKNNDSPTDDFPARP